MLRSTLLSALQNTPSDSSKPMDSSNNPQVPHHRPRDRAPHAPIPFRLASPHPQPQPNNCVLSCFARVQSVPRCPATPRSHCTHSPAAGSSTSLPLLVFGEVCHLSSTFLSPFCHFSAELALGSGPLPLCNLRWRWDGVGDAPTITHQKAEHCWPNP